MTCKLTTSTKHVRLQRKLDNLCMIIERMFDASPRPVASLKEHIARLEDLIMELPDEQCWAKLVDQYRDIAVHFWQRFEKNQTAVLSTRSQPNKSASSQSSSPWMSKTAPPVQCLRKEVKPIKVAPCSPPPLPSFRGAPRGVNSVPPGPYCLVPIPPPTDEIRAVLKQAFNQLGRIESVQTDFEATKQLLLMIGKARAITMPYWKNADLLSDIFGWAFRKLPKELRVIYRMQYRAKKKWLLDLRNFIQSQIDHYTMGLEIEALETGAIDASAGGDLGPVKGKACFYCKLDGHISTHCPVLKSTLCAKCLEFGHTDTRCYNGLKYVRLEDFH